MSTLADRIAARKARKARWLREAAASGRAAELARTCRTPTGAAPRAPEAKRHSRARMKPTSAPQRLADRRGARIPPRSPSASSSSRARDEGVDVSDSLRARIERRPNDLPSGRAEPPRAAEPPQRRRSPERLRPAIPPSPATDEEDDVPQSTRDRVAALAERAKGAPATPSAKREARPARDLAPRPMTLTRQAGARTEAKNRRRRGRPKMHARASDAKAPLRSKGAAALDKTAAACGQRKLPRSNR